ncbi:MAG TPA: RIP metalloprotease RseP [Gammaproteobacteria bacterium]|nr:RIP metalloprotease RseP [Gammaproteobacteria bacterium]
MLDVLIYPVSFIAALGILITVHEFGHFWVARIMGVKVLRFSIGFGKPLLQRTSKVDGTEYVLAAIPLGGYVKMLDEREAKVAEKDRPFAFNNQNVWKRFAIVVAGPVFNFIFAIIAFWLMYLPGTHDLKALVGEVTPGSYAEQAGFKPGDQILKIDGDEAVSWSSVRLALLDIALDNRQAKVVVKDQSGVEQLRRLSLSGISDPVEIKDLVKDIGIKRWQPPAELGEVIQGGPADKAGLRKGDLILKADNTVINDWIDWLNLVQKNPGRLIKVVVDRQGNKETKTLDIGEITRNGKIIGRVQVALPKKYWDKLDIKVEYSLFQALNAGIIRTWDMSVLMIRVLGRIVMGESSLKNISGPLTIAQYAGNTASSGLIPFLYFLAIVSISLGVLNLLPIPVLDGGHLFYYLIEIITGKQVSEQFQAAAQQFGIFLLVALMGLAFYNDILRLFG